MQTTIRVDVAVRDKLRAIADAEFDGSPLTRVLEALIDEHRHRKMIRDAHEAMARLQAQPGEWADYLAELRAVTGGGLADLPPEDFSWLEDRG
jgi:fructose-1,6-bisphosphatase/sedoheptulose 1,7-bisphosphatase-like protein